jgi:RNase P subunit RPR2
MEKHTITCRNCNKEFRVPIGAGKIKVTCRYCDSEEFLNTGQNPSKGSDLELPLKLTLEELAEKVTKTIRLKHLVKCKPCNGYWFRFSYQIAMQSLPR